MFLRSVRHVFIRSHGLALPGGHSEPLLDLAANPGNNNGIIVRQFEARSWRDLVRVAVLITPMTAGSCKQFFSRRESSFSQPTICPTGRVFPAHYLETTVRVLTAISFFLIPS